MAAVWLPDMSVDRTDITLGVHQACNGRTLPYIRTFRYIQGYVLSSHPASLSPRSWCLRTAVCRPDSADLSAGRYYRYYVHLHTVWYAAWCTAYIPDTAADWRGIVVDQWIGTACWRQLEDCDSCIQLVTYFSENINNYKSSAWYSCRPSYCCHVDCDTV